MSESDQNSQPHRYDAIILGAGPAGIAAAKKLLSEGCTNIRIIEGRDRVGGRTYTDSQLGDFGAAWTHINDSRLRAGGSHEAQMQAIDEGFLQFAQRAGYTLSFDRQKSRIYYQDGEVPREKYLGNISRVFAMMQELIDAEGRDMSAAEARDILKKSGKIDGFMEWIIEMEFGWASTGRDLKDVSVRETLNQLSLASGVLYREGQGNVVKDMAEGLEPYTQLESRVTAIKKARTFASVDVQNADGSTETIEADTLLCTIPPSVLAHKGDEYEIKLEGFPQWKRDAIAKLPSGAMNKIIMELPEHLLNKFDENQHLEINIAGLGTMFFLARPAGKNLLVGFLGGEKSIEFEKFEPASNRNAAAVQHALKFLHIVPELKELSGGDIANPHYTQWYTDPMARGAYSTPVVGAGNAREMMFKPLDDIAFFAGEACATSGWQTQVFGAIETGKEAAKNMLDALGKKNAGHSATIAAEPDRSWEIE